MFKTRILGLLLLLWFFLAGKARAQNGFGLKPQPSWHIGISGGLTHNTLLTDITSLPDAKNSSQLGFALATALRYQYNHYFALETELSYQQKNYSIDRTGNYSGAYNSWQHAYLQIPLLLQLGYGKKLRVFAAIGGYFAYHLSSRQKGRVLNTQNILNGNHQTYVYDQAIPFNSIRDNRVEIGGVLGTSISYRFARYYSALLSGRYYISVTDQQKKYMARQTERYNETWVFSAGLMIDVRVFKQRKQISM